MFSIRPVLKFLEDILNPEVFGHAVTKEVRNEARRLLGIERRE